MSEDKTIGQIREEYGAKAAGILSAYHAELDAIREIRKPEAGTYLDQLTDEQRMRLLRDQKRERADEAHRRAAREYAAETERYQDDLRARVGHVEGALFGMSSPESAQVLSRAALASEEELGTMLDLAAASGNRQIAKAALVAAEKRGFAGLVVRALEAAGPEARELYAEWSERPPEEVLERQREDVGAIVAPPDHERLVGQPQLNGPY
jgi:pyruvate/2-oxoacid:ferredoxin oxidoreductase beta subunit